MSDNNRHTGDFLMDIHTLRKIAEREEIDYLFLINALHKYSRPREKISAWLKSGDLIRVKKGLYTFGEKIAQTPHSKEILANLIYGPSAISLTYALSFYGLIPERVSTITSITNKRNKKFVGPTGNYIYHYLANDKYSIGLELHSIAPKRQFLITTPEKSLCDQIYLIDKKIKIININDMGNYLFQDLRLDEYGIKQFNIGHLIEINKIYKSTKIQLLINLIIQEKK